MRGNPLLPFGQFTPDHWAKQRAPPKIADASEGAEYADRYT